MAITNGYLEVEGYTAQYGDPGPGGGRQWFRVSAIVSVAVMDGPGLNFTDPGQEWLIMVHNGHATGRAGFFTTKAAAETAAEGIMTASSGGA